MKSYLAAAARMLSPGIFVVLGLGIVSAIIIALLPVPTHSGMQIWLGDGNHANLYRALAPEWNRRHPDLPPRQDLRRVHLGRQPRRGRHHQHREPSHRRWGKRRSLAQSSCQQ